MTITAKVIKDTLWMGSRATTFLVKYPRFVHSEGLTHRMNSKNSASSRAIPVPRMIQSIIDDTAMPIHWGLNQPGMQADEEFEGTINFRGNEYTPQELWCAARDSAIEYAEAFHSAGLHKQVVNRILEPFSHIIVLKTSTSWDNFYHLRRHKDAQPEIRELARAMYAAHCESTPFEGYAGYWHLPYADDSLPLAERIKQSVARSARTSYLTHEGKTSTPEEDYTLFDRLLGSAPLHASPAEHQLMCTDSPETNTQNGNMSKQYVQYRKTLPEENCLSYDPIPFDTWWESKHG